MPSSPLPSLAARDISPCGSMDPPPDDSSLSTLSPQPSSFEANETQFSVKYSWSGGALSINDDTGESESAEAGQEVTVTVVSDTAGGNERPTSYGKTRSGTVSRHDSTPKAGTVDGADAASRTLPAIRCDATPRAGTFNMSDATPRAGTFNMSDVTPRVANRRYTAGNDGCDKNQLSDDDIAQTPSWDVEKSFSFRKNEGQKEDLNNNQSTFSAIWDFINSLSKSESNEADEEREMDNSDDEAADGPHLTESTENDLFAAQVGLAFSEDDGDTINDPSTLAQNLSNSFTIESCKSGDRAEHSPAYSWIKYKKNHEQNDSGDTSIQISLDTTKEDETTLGQSTVRDDHGNQIPENAKMILGYENIKRRKAQKKYKGQRNQEFPTLQNTDTAPEEMERRLRELAGRISADWRGSAFMPPALARRLRDFQFAREKRRKKYGKAKPWSIIGLYSHLSGVKIDVEWAEDAAWRRQNKQPYLTWADFEHEKNAGFYRPIFTFLIVSACAVMMLASLWLNDWKFEPLSVNPMIGPSAETLLKLGAKDSFLIVVHQEVWRLASPMVLHAGLIHFFLNMFALAFVGKAIEQIHGFFPAVVQFVVPAIGGIILSSIFLPEYITVGASGGIFGLIGASIADIIMNWGLLFNEFVNERGARLSHARVLVILFLDIVLNCLIGLTPFVDNFTHLGGMLYGFLCGLSTIQLVSPRFFGGDHSTCFHKCKLRLFRSFGLFACMAGIIASSIVLFSGDGKTNSCTTCTYMSCVSFPPWAGKHEKWWYCDQCSRASAEGTFNTVTGEFISLNVRCPGGTTETVDVDESWPQDEIGLEGMLPVLCRDFCL